MNAFRSALGQFLFRWRFGLLVAGLLRALFWIGLVFLVFGVLDYYSGFSDPARRFVFGALMTVGVGAALWAIIDSISFMRRDAAMAADLAGQSGRRPVLSALELEREPNGTPMQEWLRERSIASAASSLAGFSPKQTFPMGKLRKQGGLALIIAAAFVLAFAAAPRASSTIARRLLNPDADIPPYSPLEFTLGPQPAEVLYGGEILITADISGGTASTPPRFLTRNPSTGAIEESAAFQESSIRYSRKLEKMADSVDVAFAVGRARSAWLPVRVRMQPRIQDVTITVEPPAYSKQPRREFLLGSQEFATLPGSRVTAQVTSNRPLSGGRISLETSGPHKGNQEVAGERQDTHRVRFSWVSRGGALAELHVRDVVGTASDTVKFEQKLLPDERPDVVLHRPSGEVLATPDTELPLEARAIDDLGLARVAVVRKLVGYRERSQSEAVQDGIRRHDVTGKINLASFGVLPGQTIELSLEAGDSNPNLLGVSVSDTARIRIITREQYAEMLRSQTTLEEFTERYEALQEAMEEARKSLKEMEDAAKSGDPKRAEEARQKAYEAHKKAAEVFGKIANDFQIFELDSSLAETAREVARQIGENGRQLEKLKGATPQELADAMKELMERMAAAEQSAAPEMKKGERVVAAGKVIEQAGRFSELLQEQRDLVKDMNRAEEQIRRGETKAAQALSEMARRQREIEAGLQKMEKEMQSALNELPEDFAAMKEEGEHFMELLRSLEVPPTMDQAATAAEQANSAGAGDKSREALEKLEALLKKKNGICKMCRGEGEDQFPWPQDLNGTMQQLMQSLLRRKGGHGDGNNPGQSESGTGSGGASGSTDSGFSMKGKMPRIPVYGPSRERFSRKAGPSLGDGRGSNAGAGSPGSTAAVDGDALTSGASGRKAGEAATPEAVPEVYREAVKRFFSAGEEQPAAGQTQPNSKP